MRIFLAAALPRSLEWLTLTDGLCKQEQWEWEWETDYFIGGYSIMAPKLEEIHTSSPRSLSVRECDGSAGLEIYNDTGTKRFRSPVGNRGPNN